LLGGICFQGQVIIGDVWQTNFGGRHVEVGWEGWRHERCGESSIVERGVVGEGEGDVAGGWVVAGGAGDHVEVGHEHSAEIEGGELGECGRDVGGEIDLVVSWVFGHRDNCYTQVS